MKPSPAEVALLSPINARILLSRADVKRLMSDGQICVGDDQLMIQVIIGSSDDDEQPTPRRGLAGAAAAARGGQN